MNKEQILVSLNISGAKNATKGDFEKIRKTVLDAIARLETKQMAFPETGTNGVISPIEPGPHT